MRYILACELKRSDIDFAGDLIHVYRISTEYEAKNKTQLIEGTPKTEQSKRCIPLSKKLKMYLLEKHEEAICEYVFAQTEKYLNLV